MNIFELVSTRIVWITITMKSQLVIVRCKHGFKGDKQIEVSGEQYQIR